MLHSELTTIKSSLIEALKVGLPGENTHLRMLPSGRELHPAADNENIIQSSVLLLLFPYDGAIHTCLIRRPLKMRNHGGQIAFPGGRHEPSDKDLIHTALRESYEEIGTNNNQLEIVGALTPVYVQVSNFKINPFIGWSATTPIFKIDNQEVEEIFIIQIEKLVHPGAYQLRKVDTNRGTFEAPGFYIDGLFIWGATAMIISEFNEIFKTLIAD